MQSPDDIGVLLDLSMALIKTGRSQEALDLLFEIERKDRWNPQGHYMLAAHFMSVGDFRKAAEHFGRALEGQPDFEDASINMAVALCELGDTTEAVRRMRSLIRKFPDSARVNFFYATVLYRHGDYPEALSKYQRAIEVAPTYMDPRIGLGETLFRLGRYEEAEKTLRFVIQIQPDSVPALFLLGMTLIGKAAGRTENAEDAPTIYRESLQCFDQVIALHPEHWDSRANRAFLLGLLESVDAMNAAFEALLHTVSDTAPDTGSDTGNRALRGAVLYYWSEALHRIGHGEAALLKRQEAVQADPDIENRLSDRPTMWPS